MIRSSQKHWRSIIAALAVVLGLMMPTTTPQAQSNGNPGVIPPIARPYGLSYGQWSAKWWQWALSIPEATNPLLDSSGANCAEGQAGPVWFLAGTFGGSATRTCTVPDGKALLFPVLNFVDGAAVFDCQPTGSGPCDEEALRAEAKAAEDNPLLLEASVDGVALQNLSAYRTQSPVFSITFPEGAIFGLPSGTFTPNVSDGYWVMLAPRSAGTHTIHFKGIDHNGFSAEVTYNLTVQ